MFDSILNAIKAAAKAVAEAVVTAVKAVGKAIGIAPDTELRQGHEPGLTLIELLVVLGIAGFILTIIATCIPAATVCGSDGILIVPGATVTTF